MKKIAFNIATILCSSLVGLYLVEGTVIVSGYFDSNNSVEITDSQGVSFDKRTKLEVFEDLHKLYRGGVSPATYPLEFIEFIKNSRIKTGDDFKLKLNSESILPLGGISFKNIILCNEAGEWITFDSDRYGFNNNDYVWDYKNVDFMLVGDSFAQGYCVERRSNIAGILESKGSYAINLGTGGNGPLVNFAVIKEYIELLKPKNIIWIYFEGNDLSDLKLEKNNEILNKYLKDPDFQQGLLQKQQVTDKILRQYVASQYSLKKDIVNDSWHDYVISFIKMLNVRGVIGNYRSYLKNFSNYYVEEIPIFQKILNKTINVANEHNSKIIFVYLPEYERYESSLTRDEHDTYKSKYLVIDMVESLGIEVFDVHAEILSKSNDPLKYFPFRMRGHYNEKGYKEISNALYSRFH